MILPVLSRQGQAAAGCVKARSADIPELRSRLIIVALIIAVGSQESDGSFRLHRDCSRIEAQARDDIV